MSSGGHVTVGGLSILKHNLDAYAEAYKALSAAVKAKAASEITHCDVRTVSIDGSVKVERYSELGNPAKKQKTTAKTTGTPLAERSGPSLLKSKAFGGWDKITIDVGGHTNVVKLCQLLLGDEKKENHGQALMWHIYKSCLNELERQKIVAGTTAAIFDTFKNYKLFLVTAKARLESRESEEEEEEEEADDAKGGASD